jgi:hypothetical protein
MTLRFAIIALCMALASAAEAQNTAPAALRATIQKLTADGADLDVHSRAGEERTVHLTDKTRVVLIVPAQLAEVKQGAFIGVAAVPGDGETLKALEVHVFPEAMRGTGEGFRQFDLAPNSTMTNGNVDVRVDGVSGETLTVTYKGGQQKVVVPPGTPIVGFDAGVKGDLKPGAAIIARGPRREDGSIDAAVVLVGKDGLVPPM